MDETVSNSPFISPKLRQRKQICCECRQSQLDDVEEVPNDLKFIRGQRIALCRCQQSQSFPFCDNTHEVFNRETNSNIQPIVVRITRTKSVEGPQNANFATNTTSHIEPQPTEKMEAKEIVKNTRSLSTESAKEQALRNIKRVNKNQVKGVVFTREEVAQHCTKEDCWMIIHGKVYNVTPYFPFHPGGERALLKFAGKDGTENVQFHSPKMMKLLEEYFYIGDVEGENRRGCAIM